MSRPVLSAVVVAIIASTPARPIFAEELFRTTKEVKDLIDQHKYAEAEQIVMQQEPQDKLLLAWLKIRGGKVEEGIKLAHEVMLVDVSSDSAEHSIFRLVSLVGDASNADGQRLLESYLDDDSITKSDKLWLKLLTLYAKSREPQRGENVAEHVLSLKPSSDLLRQPLFEYSVALYKAEQPTLALKYYLELRQRIPETQIDPGYQMQFAHILTAAGKPLDALQTIDTIRTEFKEYAAQNAAILLMASGLAYEKLGDIEAATREFNKIIAARDAGPQFAAFAKGATAKIQNYKADEAAQNLVDTSPDVTDHNFGLLDEEAQLARSRRFRWLLLVNLLVVAGVICAFWYRHRLQRRCPLTNASGVKDRDDPPRQGGRR